MRASSICRHGRWRETRRGLPTDELACGADRTSMARKPHLPVVARQSEQGGTMLQLPAQKRYTY